MSLFGNLSTLFGDQPSKKSAAGRKNLPLKKQSHLKKSDPAAAAPQITKPQQPPKLFQPPQRQPSQQDDSAEREAKAKAREIIVEAKDEALAIKAKAENEARDQSKKLEEQQRQLNKQLDKIEVRLNNMDQKEERLEESSDKLEKKREALEKERLEVVEKLESVSKLTRDEARKILLEDLEKRMAEEMATYIRQKQEEAKTEADDRVREILTDAMKHGATDYVPEYTISTVALPSEDVKGKIIGKSGRNIHAFEKITGVDVDLDSGATEVRLSCFDPIRREIARISLERLIKDGRIQPSRIEEVVAKVRQEIEKVTLEAGKKLCHEVGIYNLPVQLMQDLGKFKFRFSYGQNLIAHTLEETKIGIKLAHELGADVNVVKLGCLLHDIGKVSYEEEGSHVELGVKAAKKYNLPQPVIDCIAQHHEDEPFTGIEQMIVYIADAISGARPGARYENHEEYVKRLEQLEEIAMSYPGVDHAYAIQAGREVRVMLKPEDTKDNDVEVLSLSIRDQIKNNMTYPGTVTVTVIRESRGQKVAA